MTNISTLGDCLSVRSLNTSQFLRKRFRLISLHPTGEGKEIAYQLLIAFDDHANWKSCLLPAWTVEDSVDYSPGSIKSYFQFVSDGEGLSDDNSFKVVPA